MLRPTYPSFRLLLSLEWLLLATAAFMEVILPFQWSSSLLLGVSAIAVFTWLGLQLPTGKLRTRLLYTALEIILIWVPATQWGLSPRSVFLMCLVLVMRSCVTSSRR